MPPPLDIYRASFLDVKHTYVKQESKAAVRYGLEFLLKMNESPNVAVGCAELSAKRAVRIANEYVKSELDCGSFREQAHALAAAERSGQLLLGAPALPGTFRDGHLRRAEMERRRRGRRVPAGSATSPTGSRWNRLRRASRAAHHAGGCGGGAAANIDAWKGFSLCARGTGC